MASRRIPAIAGFTTFGVHLTLSPSWTACSDFGGARTGTLSGAMNSLGSIGSLVSSVNFPWLLKMTHGVKSHFFVAALLNAIAALSWVMIGRSAKGSLPG